MQTGCIVKGEAQKSPLFWRFSGGFWFSQDRLLSRNSTRKPFNLAKSPIFTNAPCKSTCLYNAPSMHTVNVSTEFGKSLVIQILVAIQEIASNGGRDAVVHYDKSKLLQMASLQPLIPGNYYIPLLSAPKSQRFLQFAIAMPIADPRNRSDFRDKREQCCIAI